MKQENHSPQINKVRRFRCPLTPYQLFTPVASVFLDNLTYEEQLLGLFNKLNELISEHNLLVNQFNQMLEDLKVLEAQVEDNTSAINQLRTEILKINNRINDIRDLVNRYYIILLDKMEKGDKNTLILAKEYADMKFKSLPAYGSITAKEYDNLKLPAKSYDDYEMTALDYDRNAKIILYGLKPIEITQTTGNSETAVISQKGVTSELNKKQDKLFDSGTNQNLKTINGESLLGTGNLEIEGGGSTTDPPLTNTGAKYANNLPMYILSNIATPNLHDSNIVLGFEEKRLINGTTGSKSITIPGATQSSAGLLTKTDKIKLDNLANIKTIGTGLSLSETGELSSTSGGSGSETPLYNIPINHKNNALSLASGRLIDFTTAENTVNLTAGKKYKFVINLGTFYNCGNVPGYTDNLIVRDRYQFLLTFNALFNVNGFDTDQLVFAATNQVDTEITVTVRSNNLGNYLLISPGDYNPKFGFDTGQANSIFTSGGYLKIYEIKEN